MKTQMRKVCDVLGASSFGSSVLLLKYRDRPNILRLQRSSLPHQIALVPWNLPQCNMSQLVHDRLPSFDVTSFPQAARFRVRFSEIPYTAHESIELMARLVELMSVRLFEFASTIHGRAT